MREPDRACPRQQWERPIRLNGSSVWHRHVDGQRLEPPDNYGG
jgi:hypothetical protein